MTACAILTRHLIEVNTDPLRRCYDGCHFSSKFVWTDWEILYSRLSKEKVESTLKYWTDLNDFAVSQRGEGAKREFKVIEETEEMAL